MVRIGMFLWCSLALLVLPMTRPDASQLCPPQTSTYEKCPNDFKQSWLIPPLTSYVETDTVVDQIGDNLWEYHWCLKSRSPVDDEIFFIWPDHNVTGQETGCGGFWGRQMQTRFPPYDVQSTAAVGPALREIHPMIQLPAGSSPTRIWHEFLEFVTSIFSFFSLDKTDNSSIAVGLTIRSTATPIMANAQQIGTRYKLEYADLLSDGLSPIRFSFSDDLIDRAKELEGLFSFSNKPRSLGFTKVGPPTNVIGSIAFVGPDGYEVGSMPVSLAVPSD